MSGVILVGALLAMVAGWGVGLLFFAIGRRIGARRSTEIATLVGLGFAVISFVPVLGWLAQISTTTLIAMDPRQGEKKLEHFGLPPNATSDFCYRISAVGVMVLADFQMDEPDFQSWMNAQKWKAVPFELGPDESSIQVDGGAVTTADTEVYPVRQYESRTGHKVSRGYCYFWAKPDNPDHTTRIIYDRDTNRAYLEHTTY
jgi:hypothetical protein